MSTSKVTIGINNVFSLVAREKCMTNLKNMVIPKFGKVPTNTAAVLVPLCRVDNVPSLLYAVRTSNSLDSGEVTFPGGLSEKGEPPVKTALRKTEEEIGLMPSKIDIWGRGPTIPSKDNELLITPIISSINHLVPSDFSLDTRAVREVFTVPLAVLCEPRHHYHTCLRQGHVLPVFVADYFKIWGVTGYITHAYLSSLLAKDVYNNDWMKTKLIYEK